MTMPNETIDEAGASTDQEVDPRADAATQPSSELGASLSPALREFIDERPVAAALASAAVGAGLVAILILATRETEGAGRSMANGAARNTSAADGFATLRAQVADLAQRLAATLPSTDKVSSAIDASKGTVHDTVSVLRGQTEEILDRLRPYANATVDMARAYPVWTSVAVGVLGALLGSQLLGGGAHDKVEQPAD
jgi:hypothetical protein